MTKRQTSAQRVAKQTTELAIAAPLVVAQRLTDMALAGPNPDARTRREMATMGSEKVAAFWQSWAAMGMPLWRLQMQWWQMWMRHPTQLPRVNALPVLAAGLAPVHRRAVANAKRLSKRR